MIVEGTYTFAAPREAVWAALLDPDVVARTLPGSSRITQTGDDRYEGTLRIGIGPIASAEFDLVIALAEKQIPSRYRMEIDGRGALGYTRGTAIVDLTDSGDSTALRYQADMTVGGAIAVMGQGLLDRVSRLLLNRGLDAMSAELARRLAKSPP